MKLFDLYADLKLDAGDFNDGVRKASDAGAEFQKKTEIISAKAVALGHAMYEVGKQAAKTVVTLGKDIIEEYQQTEQLLGGVSTMFKKDAQTVIDNAAAAFKTAGMSANDYMQTVTSFSASLLQGLGEDTEAAAKVADMAVTDMADNANKFGTNMGMIQNAYQGFAKDNFTMLDNLKLGYGGTADEMARLVNESGVLGDSIEVTAATVKDVPLDKIFEAIHAIQVEMGITGTTAMEASSTISGSASAFAAAWQNVLSGLANKDADISQLMDALFETGQTYVSNVIALFPTIAENAQEALALVGSEVASALADVYNQFANAWDTELPGVITAGANSIIYTINEIFGTNIPTIESIDFPTWDEIVETASAWWEGIRSSLETLARWTVGIFETPEATAEEMREVFGAWWESTAKPAIEGAASWVLSLFDVPEEGESEIAALINGWWTTNGKYVENACTWVLTLFDVPDETAEDIKNLISTWWIGIASIVSDTCKVIFSLAEGDPEAAKESILAWWQNVTTFVGNLLSIGFDILVPSVTAVLDSIQTWWESTAKPVVEGAISWTLSLFNVPTETAEDIANLISTWWGGIIDAVSNACKVIFSLAEGDPETAKQQIVAWWENVKTLVIDLLSITFDIFEPSVTATREAIKSWWEDVCKGLGLVIPVGSGVHDSSAGTPHGGGGLRWDDLPGHATGLSWVPYDNYIARLHVGEAVLTRQEAAAWRNGGASTGRIESLLSEILTAMFNPIPAVVDGDSVYDYVSNRFSKDVKNKSFAL